MAVPNTFASATSAIPLANLDANFAYYDAGFSLSGSAVTFAGSITLTTGTANGVPYLNASKVLTSGGVLTFNGTILSSTGFAGALNGTVGATTASTGAFTTLSASSTVSGAGFSTYLASPPAIGGTAAAAGTFTALTGTSITNSGLTATRVVYSGTAGLEIDSANLTFSGTILTSTGFAGPLNGTVGATTPAAGAFTTLSTTGAVTITGGTANGVAYLDGSKVLTTGSALVFDGTNLNIGATGYPYKLSAVRSSDGVVGYFRRDSGTINPALMISAKETGNTVGFDTDYAGATSPAMTFSLGSAEQMRLTSTGLGIGTTSPGAKLGVSGTNTNDGAGYWTAFLYNTAAPAANIGTGIAFSTNVGTFGATLGTVEGIKENATSDNYASALKFTTRANGGAITERMRITSAGNVGIGSLVSYEAKLKVATTNGSADFAASGINICGTSEITSGQVLPISFTPIGNDTTRARAAMACIVGANWGFGNLGFYTRGAADASVLTTADEKMRLTSDGNLGIGTSSPAQKLDVNGVANVNTIQTSGAPAGSFSASKWFTQTENTVNSRTYICGPNSSTYGNWDIYLATSTGGPISALNFTPSATIFGIPTTGAEAARIDSSGNLLVGTTINGSQDSNSLSFFKGNGTLYTNHVTGTTTTTNYAIFSYAGGLIGSISQAGTTGVLYNVTSDYRLKTVIGAVADSGSRIDALQPVEYTWNADGSRTRGFLAHQFQEVYAGSVTGTKDAVDADGKPVYQQMQAGSSEVIADLVAEIQSLRKRLAALEAK
jgi:hypothetical protein